MATRVTATTLKALGIVKRFAEEHDNRRYPGNGIWARAFARAMWPCSEGWTRMRNCGRGHGMVLSAGSYLCKLRERGLVFSECLEGQYQNHWFVTARGDKLVPE